MSQSHKILCYYMSYYNPLYNKLSNAQLYISNIMSTDRVSIPEVLASKSELFRKN